MPSRKQSRPVTIRLDGPYSVTDADWQIIAEAAAQCRPPATAQDYIRFRLSQIAEELRKEKEQSHE